MNIPKALMSEVLEEAKIVKKILIISDDFDPHSFETLKELLKDGNYFYSESSNCFSFEADLVEDFEDIRDIAYLRKYDAFLIDYGIVGDDKDNLDMIKDMTKSGIVIWCGGLNGHYSEDCKRLFPDRKYMHNLKECSIGASDIKIALYGGFNLGVAHSDFTEKALDILYNKLNNKESLKNGQK